MLWRYKFSQLKGSSDDGKSKIKFLFQNQDSKSIEAKVINSERCLLLHVKGNVTQQESQSNKVQENELILMWLCIDFFFSFRSWSSQISLLCFTVFMLFLLPKLLAWTRCLWRVKATRLPRGFLHFPASHVFHRHLNWNTPLDRCCSLWSPSNLDMTVA